MDDNVHTYRIPALTTTRKGTLLAVYDMRRRMGRDLQEDIDIGLSRSTDGGQTWSPTQVIMDMGEYGGLGQEQNGCSDPGILVDPKTGRIFCAAVWMWGKPGKHQWSDDGSEAGFEIGKAAQFLMVESTSDGRRWSAPRNMTRELKREEWVLFAPSPQGGIALRDVTLVMPSQGRNEEGAPFSNIMYSKDHGRSWTVSNPAVIGSSECQAVQLDDGSLMLNMRTERDIALMRSVFTTRDLGQTWTAHPTHLKGLIEPSCNGSLLRFDYQDGGEQKHVLIFANPHSQQRRDHHTLKVSFDEGMTWPEEYHLLLDVGGGAGYPSLTRIDDRHVGLVYEGSQSHVVFEKFSIDELLHREVK
ncbi:MAG: neuraminidase [Planctomycetaceae bacterium]|nr:neuraminidase [Planctomycetaceae bacterium]